MSSVISDSENDSSTDDLNKLLDRCQEHPDYQPIEKETTITFDATTDRYTIESFQGGVYRNLLQREDFEVKWVVGINDDGEHEQIASVHQAANRSNLRIVGVVGSLPIGTLKIGSGRQNNYPSGIVSTR